MRRRVKLDETSTRIAKFFAYALGGYLGLGVVYSSILAWAVPATSIAGRLYLTVMWLLFWLQRPLGYELNVPAWCFSFS